MANFKKNNLVGQGLNNNFYSPGVSKGELLLRMLPFGVCSTQGLAMLGRESQVLYKFIEGGYVVKEERKISRKGRYKKEIFCYLTPKGMRRICEDNFEKPSWIYFLDYHDPSFHICPTLSTQKIQTLASIQDAIIFSSYAGVPNLLTSLLVEEPTSVLILQYISGILSSKNHNTVLEKTADAVSFHLSESKSENSFVSDCSRMFTMPADGDLSKLFLSDSLYLKTSEKVFDDVLKKKQSREYFMTHRETTAACHLRGMSPPDNIMRDTSIGIYAGEKQSIQVFVSTKNGMMHNAGLHKKGQRMALICESYASREATRSMDDICRTAVILCRKKTEFSRVIFDPSGLRSNLIDKRFCGQFRHVFMIPMNAYGMKAIRNYGANTVAEYDAIHLEDKKMLPELFDNLRLLKETLFDVEDNCKAFIGYELDAIEIYNAIEESEMTDRPVTLILKTWQQDYFDQLQKSWKVHRIFVPDSENIGFKYLLLEEDVGENPYDSLMPADGTRRNVNTIEDGGEKL